MIIEKCKLSAGIKLADFWKLYNGALQINLTSASLQSVKWYQSVGIKYNHHATYSLYIFTLISHM